MGIYSSAGYGSAEDDSWVDMVPMENQGSELDWYDDSLIDEDPSTQWDAPPVRAAWCGASDRIGCAIIACTDCRQENKEFGPGRRRIAQAGNRLN